MQNADMCDPRCNQQKKTDWETPTGRNTIIEHGMGGRGRKGEGHCVQAIAKIFTEMNASCIWQNADAKEMVFPDQNAFLFLSMILHLSAFTLSWILFEPFRKFLSRLQAHSSQTC